MKYGIRFILITVLAGGSLLAEEAKPVMELAEDGRPTGKTGSV